MATARDYYNSKLKISRDIVDKWTEHNRKHIPPEHVMKACPKLRAYAESVTAENRYDDFVKASKVYVPTDEPVLITSEPYRAIGAKDVEAIYHVEPVAARTMYSLMTPELAKRSAFVQDWKKRGILLPGVNESKQIARSASDTAITNVNGGRSRIQLRGGGKRLTRREMSGLSTTMNTHGRCYLEPEVKEIETGVK